MNGTDRGEKPSQDSDAASSSISGKPSSDQSDFAERLPAHSAATQSRFLPVLTLVLAFVVSAVLVHFLVAWHERPMGWVAYIGITGLAISCFGTAFIYLVHAKRQREAPDPDYYYKKVFLPSRDGKVFQAAQIVGIISVLIYALSSKLG